MQAPNSAADLKDSKIQRQTMVDCQIRTFEVTDQLVIDQFLAVPRERFLPDDVRGLAYSDIGLTISTGSDKKRYLLPPLILARLIQGGRVGPGDRILDVASGSGYSAAILAGLGSSVLALEADSTLRHDLKMRLGAFGLDRVRTIDGPLQDGAESDGPFDVILVNGAIETGLDALFGQLAEGGRLLTIQRFPNDPTGRAAKAMRFEKSGGQVSGRILFDASAPLLEAFKKEAAFQF
ncbi:protein-L-isoaspartate O-methyltransferase [Beijerinckia sp. L45]|uniref:protein-L-isoaspartate O-methyltransferase family protein n=1 Tax=Beijerinckia sp. L45 TaxID=1641855 RepID=UPI00131D86C7|nr:protein-L-isoaspartate O-methyltransferase [Beijerinckia sp. L45]